MRAVMFIMPGHEILGNDIVRRTGTETGSYVQRTFPDGETYTRILTEVKDRKVVILANLADPDRKIMPLYVLCRTLRDSGAAEISLLVPYLPYMRQDMAFNPGEAVASRYFANLVSGICDRVITVDPHLHRLKHLSDIFTVPCVVLHTAPLIAEYIKSRFGHPLLVGPDEESEQWVSGIAHSSDNPYMVFRKKRLGDREVEIEAGAIASFKDRQPLLIDDMISSGTSMTESAKILLQSGMEYPACIIIHPVLSEAVYDHLKRSGFSDIVSCNTIPHVSNGIDIAPLISGYFKRELSQNELPGA